MKNNKNLHQNYDPFCEVDGNSEIIDYFDILFYVSRRI